MGPELIRSNIAVPLKVVIAPLALYNIIALENIIPLRFLDTVIVIVMEFCHCKVIPLMKLNITGLCDVNRILLAEYKGILSFVLG